MNDPFISIQRVQNSVLIAGRDIDDDGDYSDGGGDDDGNNNNNNNKKIQWSQRRN